MSDELERLALARSLASFQRLLNLRDLQLVNEVTIRLCQRASEGPRSRVTREAIDDLIAGVEASLAEQDAERADVREAARVEMLGEKPALEIGFSARLGLKVCAHNGITPNDSVMANRRVDEWAPDQLTRVSPDSAVIALGDERARDPELEVDVELDSDPGPHTHVYQGTDRGDECQVCGRMRDQFADLADEWGVRDVGGGA